MTHKKQRLLQDMFAEALGDPEKEQEYAGRMEPYCKWCDCYMGNREINHDESCFHVRAKEIAQEQQP